MVKPAKFFENGEATCGRCGSINNFGSSDALYHANLSTRCTGCGFQFLRHTNKKIQKLMELSVNNPEWQDLLRNGSMDVIKQRLDELVPIAEDTKQ